MIDSDRLDELETFRPDDDTPDDAKVRIDTRDLRDLVALIPYARKAAQLEQILEKTTAILNKTGDLINGTVKLAELGELRKGRVE